MLQALEMHVSNAKKFLEQAKYFKDDEVMKKYYLQLAEEHITLANMYLELKGV